MCISCWYNRPLTQHAYKCPRVPSCIRARTAGYFDDYIRVYELQYMTSSTSASHLHHIHACDFSLLFLSLPYLWSRLPPLPPSAPLLSHRPSSVFCFFLPPVVFHQRTEHLSAQALLPLERSAFLSINVVCVGKHACCVYVYSAHS